MLVRALSLQHLQFTSSAWSWASPGEAFEVTDERRQFVFRPCEQGKIELNRSVVDYNSCDPEGQLQSWNPLGVVKEFLEIKRISNQRRNAFSQGTTVDLSKWPKQVRNFMLRMCDVTITKSTKHDLYSLAQSNHSNAAWTPFPLPQNKIKAHMANKNQQLSKINDFSSYIKLFTRKDTCTPTTKQQPLIPKHNLSRAVTRNGWLDLGKKKHYWLI